MMDGKTDRKFFLLHSNAYCHWCNTKIVGRNFTCNFLHGADLIVSGLTQGSSPSFSKISFSLYQLLCYVTDVLFLKWKPAVPALTPRVLFGNLPILSIIFGFISKNLRDMFAPRWMHTDFLLYFYYISFFDLYDIVYVLYYIGHYKI